MDDVWEIIELDSGELALKKADTQDTLMTGKLSAALRQQFSDQYVEVAKVMLSAGMQMVSELSEQETLQRNVDFEDQHVH